MRPILSQSEQFSWRVASGPDLYRGVNISWPDENYAPEEILRYLHEQGRDRGTGLGRHWSTIPGVSEGYAEFGEETEDYDAGGPDRLQVLLRSRWDGRAGLDPMHTNRGIDPESPPEGLDPYEESERTLLPGTALSLAEIRARRPGQPEWQSWAGEWQGRA